MDFTFCVDLGEFPGIGFPQTLSVSTAVGHISGIIEFCKNGFLETKISQQNVKANANLHTWTAP